MKIVVANKKDYLDGKLAGKEVVSAAAVYGYSAMNDKTPNSFMVVVLNCEGFSSFKYKKDGKFHIVGSEEDVPHHLSDILTKEIIQDDKISRWWNCVFFERDGIYKYDTCYDSFEIALPLCSIHDEMTSGVKWEEMLVDTQNDYKSGNLGFKKIRLKVECDPF
jgi:hypothetical protein